MASPNGATYPIRHIVDAGLPAHDPARTLVVVVRCYIDVSGNRSDKNVPFVVGAGLVASEAAWNAFEPDWEEVLTEFGAPYLHMKECANWRGPWKDWLDGDGNRDEPRRARFLQRMIAVVAQHKIRAVSRSILKSDFDRMNAVFRMEESIGSIYTWACMEVMHGVRKWAAENAEKWQFIEYIVEKGDLGQGQFLEVMGRLGLMVNPRSKSFLDLQGKKRYLRPFEPCDLLAFEHKLFVERRDFSKTVRKSGEAIEDTWDSDKGDSSARGLYNACIALQAKGFIAPRWESSWDGPPPHRRTRRRRP